MWGVIKNGYRSGWAFMLACPLLFLVPVVIEMIQHVVEVKIGMYDSLEAAKTTEHHPARMAFGMIKILGLLIGAYWATRFAAFGHDSTGPSRRDPAAFKLYGIFVIVQLILTAISLYAGTLGTTVAITEFVLVQILGGFLLLWGIAASVGNGAIGPIQSVKIAGFHGLWIGFFSFVAVLPLMVPHYGLAAVAVFSDGNAFKLWSALIVDSVLVGLLSAVIGAMGWYLADWVAKRQQVALLPKG